MEQVREKIRNYIKNGTIKTEGIRKLKREFNIEERKLLNMWLEERERLEVPIRGGKKKTLKPHREEVIEKAIKKNGIELQLTVAIEELSELQQAICKYKRGEKHNVEEEIADVKIRGKVKGIDYVVVYMVSINIAYMVVLLWSK